jgi:cytochrome c-type biogenesis protein
MSHTAHPGSEDEESGRYVDPGRIRGGLFSCVSPCLLPPVPSYLSFITGMSVDPLQAGGTPRRRRIVGRSIAFVLGFSVVFVAM